MKEQACENLREKKGNQYGNFSKKLKKEWPCDAAIPLLCVCPKESLEGGSVYLMSARPCSLQHDFQEPRLGINLRVYPQMNG